MRYLLLLTLAFLSAAQLVNAQGTKADYERSDLWGGMMNSKLTNVTLRPSWVGEGSTFWYRREIQPGEWEFLLVKSDDHQPTPAFDHEALAAKLKELTGHGGDAKKLPISDLTFDEDLKSVSFDADDKRYRFDVETKELKEVGARRNRGPRRNFRNNSRPRSDFTRPSRTSPDGDYAIEIDGRSLILKDVKNSQERTLWMLEDDSKDEAISPDVFWAEDLSHLVAVVEKKGGDRKVYYVESSPKDQLQPKLKNYDYLKPGDDVLQKRLVLIDIESGKATPVSSELFSNQWGLDEFHWSPDGKELRFFFNQRGHQVFRLLGLNMETGEVRTIIEEKSDTFLDWAYKRNLVHLPKTDEYLWTSERDGWNHIYLYDAATGKVKRQLTQGEWVVRKFRSTNEENREVIIELSGYVEGQNPYYIHAARIGLDDGKMTLLTEGNGSHTVDFSPDGQVFVDTWSRVDCGPRHVLRDAKSGDVITDLGECDLSAIMQAGWIAPEPFVAKARDGVTDIYGCIYRPSTFDPSKKYPVIEWIYAGPHGSHAPITFSASSRSQALAELGFVVVMLDGMGTSDRSKAFHDVCWKNIADAGFPDRKLWIKEAAKTRPWMDLTRVGIGGGSAGGQNAMRALIDHHDFYHVAVADCGCHDNRMDKIWWNEQWMGWPIGPHYEEQSNVTGASKMEGKLFLIVGEADENVDPASTMQVVNALIKNDKDFDLLVVPGTGHGAGTSTSYGWRRWRDFYVRHLLGVEPRAN